MTHQQAIEEIKAMSKRLMHLSNNIGVGNFAAHEAVIQADIKLQDFLKTPHP